jgi:hypothetical protein
MTFKNFLNESSLSRIWKQTSEHESGTISAFRFAEDCGNGNEFSTKENKARSSKLKAKLLKLGYGVTKIDGTYIENYNTPNAKEVKEEPFIVIDIKDSGNLKKDLITLGQKFDQDSVTFSLPSGEYFLISSNTCPEGYPGNGKVGVEVKLGKPLFGKNGEFHSKVNGRPFVFENILTGVVTLDKLSIGEIRSITELSKD